MKQRDVNKWLVASLCCCVFGGRERWVSKCDTTSGLFATECGKEKEEKSKWHHAHSPVLHQPPSERVTHKWPEHVWWHRTNACKQTTDRPTDHHPLGWFTSMDSFVQFVCMPQLTSSSIRFEEWSKWRQRDRQHEGHATWDTTYYCNWCPMATEDERAMTAVAAKMLDPNLGLVMHR